MSQKPIDVKDIGKTLALNANATVGSRNLPVNKSTLQQTYVHPFPQATFEIDTKAEFRFSSFRTINEEDPDGILLFMKGNAPTAPSAWMKYQLEGDVKASAGTSLGDLGFKTVADRAWILSDYRKHDREETFLSAITNDASNLRTVFDFDDIRSLEPQNAVALEVKGELCASIQLAWSDVLCSELATLTRCLPTGKVAAIRLSTGVCLQGKVKLTDDYLLVIAALDKSRYRVAVRKAKGRETGASLDVGLSAEIENLDSAVAAILDQLFDGRYTEVKDLLAAADPNNLASEQQDLLNWACGQLGLADALQKFEDLRTKVGNLATAIEGMAKRKITLSFCYEYSRIEEDKTLLQVIVPIEFLNRHHEKLVRGDISSAMIEASEPHLPGQLETYLHEHSVTRTQCLGFTLGLGKWKASGKSRKVLKEVWRENIHCTEKTLAFQGLGEYRTEGPSILVPPTWVVDLKAETKVYAPEPLLAKSFELGLHLLFQWPSTKELHEEEAEEHLDSALLWRALSANAFPSAKRAFRESIGKAGQSLVQLRFGDHAIRALLLQLAGKELKDFAPPLAAALPWKAMFKGRKEPDVRCELYTGAWARFFANPCMSLDQVARGVERDIRELARSPKYQAIRANLEDLAIQEGYYPSRMPGSFIEVIQANSSLDEWNCRTCGTIENIQDFCAATKKLSGAIHSDQDDYMVIESSYKKMTAFWLESPLHARAMGALFMDIVTDGSGFPLDDVQVSFTFQEGTSADETPSETLVLGSKLS